MTLIHKTSSDSIPQETSPLLSSSDPAQQPKWPKSVLHRAYITALAVSLSFGVTQVPLLYVFKLMTCDSYYETHPFPVPEPADRCAIREIEARTARSVALLAASTTIFGLMNLLITGWTIKRFGVKTALLISVFWPAARLAVQNVGVMTGGDLGILIVQCSQVMTIIGGPNGYVLALNSFVTDVVQHEERTGAIGRLQGCMLVGSAVGFLAGGIVGDVWGILAPFRITLLLFLVCSVYVVVALPAIPPERDVAARETHTGLKRFVGPLHIFAPRKYVLQNGRSTTHYGALTLGTGVFLAILATGYLPTVLQMYSTDEFQFRTRENGLLIFMYSSLRGLYLTFIFPQIISTGRKWMRKQNPTYSAVRQEEEEEEAGTSTPGSNASQRDSLSLQQDADLPISANEIGPVDPLDTNDADPPNPDPQDEEETFAFDLLYARTSLIVDAVLTSLAMLVARGWQMYLVAAVLPLAAGTGSAAKGSLLQMIPSAERVDALAGITLVENIARLSTTAVFGMVFAALAEVGKSWAVYGCNAAVAVCGFVVLCLTRFPPERSRAGR